ncbi:MAG: phosphoribosylformylglycinamidine synthase subunit PurS [Deltaproteobacteria bacterium]|nr:phosphoribosylformylglycinamidine synthase subunit PurS [Deltaproteobacteria bacterium]
MKAKVFVYLKKGVLDPQGKAVEHAGKSLGFEEVKEVRVGKMFEISWEGNADSAKTRLQELAQKLLANTVIEDFSIKIEDD